MLSWGQLWPILLNAALGAALALVCFGAGRMTERTRGSRDGCCHSHGGDEDGETHCGPSAQDLPPKLVARRRYPRDPEDYERLRKGETPQSEPDLMVDVTSMVGVLWGAVQELAARLTSLEGRR